MKKELFFLMLLLVAGVCQAQTIFIANNNAGAVGGVNVFTGATALTDAMTAASDGDIIYVIPSPTSYGNITIAKQLTLFGIGFDPDNDNSVHSIIGTNRIDLTNSNIRVSGFTIPGTIYTNGAISNITVDKCTFLYIANNGGTAQGNILIQNNIIGQNASANATIINFGLASSNIIINNNIIYNNLSTTTGMIISSPGTRLENNIFVGASGASYYAFRQFENGTVKNNIFYGVQPLAGTGGGPLFTGNDFQYNLSFGAASNIFPTTDGNTSANNIENTDPLFVNLPYGTTYSFSYDPNLQTGSPGIGTGELGTDIGIFGGGSPFDINGTPLPLIQVINLPPTISQGDSLPVNIKGRGN
jgi:hypothetical protein